MRVLVTGATGFIGGYVIEALLAHGGVEVIASATSARRAEATPWMSRVRFVEHRIGEEAGENLAEKFGHPDKVIHLAWSGLPNYKKFFHFEDVLPVQYRFLKTLVEGGVRDITVAGTCFEYGMQEGELHESFDARPANPYAVAKDTLRRFLELLGTTQSFRLKWARLFYMWGRGQSETAILPQLQKAVANGETVFNMSGGEQLRDYLPVEEVAHHLVRISLQDAVTGVINVCSGAPVSIRSLVENYLAETGASIRLNLGYYPYPDYEPMQFWGNPAKLHSIAASDIKS